ncbi:MAG: sulfotransferase [Chthoniobacterales bacterium]
MSAPAKEQLPSWLRRIEDPYGIVWRLSNVARRLSVRRTLKFAEGYLRHPQFTRPVFILGVPRSGTTTIFLLLEASTHLGSIGREGHDIWRMYHHPRYSGWQSDSIGPGAIKRGERRFVYAFLYAYAGARRFVEKTPENSLRVPYLLELFPDALFVVVWRNPCDVISSLINGWRHPRGRFRSYFVPEDLHIPDYPHRRQWCFALVKGWRDYRASPIPEIAFAQWAQPTEALLAARALVPAAQWHEMFLEDLIAAPRETLVGLCRFTGLEMEEHLGTELAKLLRTPANALTPARNEKWRTDNEQCILELLPRIVPLAGRIGYRVDPQSGSCTRP